jgi:hypothetical protein
MCTKHVLLVAAAADVVWYSDLDLRQDGLHY